MAKALQNGIWQIESPSLISGLSTNPAREGDVLQFADREIAAAQNIESVFSTHGLELPSSWWRGARLIKNGFALSSSNSVLSKILIHDGLTAYEIGNSITLAERERGFINAIANSDLDSARLQLDRIRPELPELPFPKELPPALSVDIAGPSELLNIRKRMQAAELVEEKFNVVAENSQVLRDLTTELEARIQNLDDGFASSAQATDSRIRDLASEMDRAIEGVKESYLEDRGLSEPVEYWDKRATMHGRHRWLWLAAFSVLSGAFVLIVLIMLYFYGGKLGSMQASGWSAALLLVGIPAGVSIWILRTIATIQRNEAALHDDAAERRTMLQAYISMLAGGQMTLDDRSHVLRAVFRPRSVVEMDDANPTPVAQLVGAFRDETRKS